MDESNEGNDPVFERARAGDEAAIGDVISRHLPHLVTYVRLRTGQKLRDRESISDLVQSACREVLTDLPERSAPTSEDLRARLFQAAQRKVVDRARYWKAERRDRDREERLGDASLAPPHRDATPSQYLMAEEELERFERALAALSEDHREVVLLARVVGLGHAEIALVMNRTAEATRSLLARALTELTEHF